MAWLFPKTNIYDELASSIEKTRQTDESAGRDDSDACLIDYPKDLGKYLLECRFCAETLSLPYTVIPPEWALYDYFHSDCRTCEDEDSTLCDWCTHFRLRHLLECTEERFFGWPIPIHYVKESIQSQESPNCAICSFIRQIVRASTSHVSDIDAIYMIAPDMSLTKARGVWSEGCSGMSRCTVAWRPDQADPYSYLTLGVGFKPAPPSTTGRGSTIADQAPSVREDAGPDSESNTENNFQGWSMTRAKALHDNVDWETMKETFNFCGLEHEKCFSSGFKPPQGFRLIDTKERCIVGSHESIKFCALSYVWGSGGNSNLNKTDVLTKPSLERLEQRGSLTAARLPNTIEDAIEACSALGLRYLWVDRLCIVQDDERSKNHQIHAMGDIFASAELVLIASSSENMHAGIPGVRSSRQTEQWRLSSPNLDLVWLPRLDQMIEWCEWRIRAWTYQESVLARRKLWLTGAQAYFQCREGVFSENTIHVSDDETTYTLYKTPSKRSSIFKHNEYLEGYTKRNLTFQSDICNAFIGIANRVYEADVSVYGLPRPDFDQALLWRTSYFPVDRRDAGNLTLPSWSWASVKSPVEIADYDCFSFCGTLVQWTVCVESDGQPSLERINADNAPISWIEREDLSVYRNWESVKSSLSPGHGLSPFLYMALAWSQDCIGLPRCFGFQSFNKHTFSEMSDLADYRWLFYSDFYQMLDSEIYQSQRDTTNLPSTCIPGSLIGRVQTATLEIPMHSDGKSGLVHNGRQIGAMSLSTSSWRRGSTVKAIALSVSNVASPEENNALYLQNLSSSYPIIRRKDSSEEETTRVVAAGEAILRDPNENLTFFHRNGEALLPPAMLNLMIIEDDGPSYRRIGIGWAYMARWVQVDPKFETITLT